MDCEGGSICGLSGKLRDVLTLPDSPAPSKSILISFLAMMRSFLSWLSISSFPAIVQKGWILVFAGRKWGKNQLALASVSTVEDCTQPISKGITELWELLRRKQKNGGPRRTGRRRVWMWRGEGRPRTRGGREDGWSRRREKDLLMCKGGGNWE